VSTVVALSLLSIVGLSSFAISEKTGSINGNSVGGVSDVKSNWSYTYCSGGYGVANVNATFYCADSSWKSYNRTLYGSSSPETSPSATVILDIPSNHHMLCISGHHTVTISGGSWSSDTYDY